MKKYISILGAVLLIILGIQCFSSTVFAETTKNFNYEVLDNGTVKITAYNGSAKKLTIPKKIKGKQVTVIGRHCFLDNDTIETLIIPEGVRELEKSSLFSMLSLKNLTISQTVVSMTDCGIGWYTEASDHPSIAFRVVKNSAGLKYVAKNHSNSKIIANKKTKATLYFDLTGGICNNINKCVKKNSKIGKLPKPSKYGYVFVGWYTKPNGGKKISANTKIKSTKDVTYYAKWKESFLP